MISLPVQAAITVLAGTGAVGAGGDGGPAVRATLNNPFGLVRGPDHALWFCDYAAHIVRRISPEGVITTEVGDGRPILAGDGGAARAASLNFPHELRFDREGNLWIADTSNHAIRRRDARTGVLTTVAGNGKPGYSGDNGPASQSQLNLPISLQLDRDGNLYVADIGNHVIRKVDVRSGVISTFAGTGKAGATPDGSPISGTPLNGPRSLDFDASGDLWLVTREGNQLLRFDRTAGVIRWAAGTGKKGFSGNGGPATSAELAGPKGLAVAPDGNVYLADTENHVIRRLNVSQGRLELVAGTGQRGDGPEGDPLRTRLSRPHGIFVDSEGTIYISDSENHRIRVLNP